MKIGEGWSPDEREAALRLSWSEFHRVHPRRTNGAYVQQRTKARRAAPEPDLSAIAEVAREAAKGEAVTILRERIDAERGKLIEQEVQRETALAITAQARHETFLATLQANIARMPAPLRVVQPTASEPSGTPETMVAVVSDIHVGKLVDESFVGEGFAYNRYLYHERLARWEQAIIDLRSIHERAFPIPRLTVLLLGDLVDGVDMRRGHGLRVDIPSAVKQALLVASTWRDTLTRLSAIFPEGIDVVSVPGNHGRVGEFGVAQSMDNWDYVASTILATMMDQVPSVRFRVRTQLHDIVQLGRLTTYVAHGQSIKGGGGFAGLPLYGIHRAAAHDTGLHGRLFDLYIIGHFHTPTLLSANGSTILVNGAWDGGDDFSVNQLKQGSAPVQWVFGVHPRRGMTWLYPVYLADQRLASPVFDALEAAA